MNTIMPFFCLVIFCVFHQKTKIVQKLEPLKFNMAKAITYFQKTEINTSVLGINHALSTPSNPQTYILKMLSRVSISIRYKIIT